METIKSWAIITHDKGSYRTYEEWKLLKQFPRSLFRDCSYRTYEEWKLGILVFSEEKETVLTVPMRNGNYISSITLSIHLPVLTVPMRNGNMV